MDFLWFLILYHILLVSFLHFQLNMPRRIKGPKPALLGASALASCCFNLNCRSCQIHQCLRCRFWGGPEGNQTRNFHSVYSRFCWAFYEVLYLVTQNQGTLKSSSVSYKKSIYFPSTKSLQTLTMAPTVLCFGFVVPSDFSPVQVALMGLAFVMNHFFLCREIHYPQLRPRFSSLSPLGGS